MKKYLLLIVSMVFVVIFLVSGCSTNEPTTVQKEEIQTEFSIGDKKVILEEKEIIKDKLNILLPNSFTQMTEEMARLKYPSERRPPLIYTNEEGSINIAFNYTQNEAKDNKILELKDLLKKSFSNLYPTATWYDDKVEIINGKNVGVLELLSPGLDTQIYNLIFFFEIDGRLMLTSFNCTEEEMTQYKPVALNIMKSIKFK